MVKPVSKWEAVMWASLAVILVCVPITALLQDDWTGAWVSLTAGMAVLIAAGGERRRVLQQRNRN